MAHLSRSSEDGHLRKGASGHLVNDCCLCKYAEPGATITVTDNSCEEVNCTGIEGSYTYDWTSDLTNGCHKRLTKSDSSAYLFLLYCKGTGQWYSYLQTAANGNLYYYGDASGGASKCTSYLSQYRAVNLTCTSSVLSGTFVLPGQGDCAGCEVSVTLT